MATSEQLVWVEQSFALLHRKLDAARAEAVAGNSWLPDWAGSLVSGWNAKAATTASIDAASADLRRYERATLPKLRSGSVSFTTVERDLTQFKRTVESYSGDIAEWRPLGILAETAKATAQDVGKGVGKGLAIGLPVLALLAGAVFFLLYGRR